MKYIREGFQSEQVSIVSRGAKYEQNLKITIIFALFSSRQYSDLCSSWKMRHPCLVVVRIILARIAKGRAELEVVNR